MKVAILGGTGFMGYSLVRKLLDRDGVTPVIYGSNPKSLVNLARHDVDFRYVPTSKLGEVRFDDDTEWIINYAHPFTQRDGVSPAQQIEMLSDLFIRSLEKDSSRRLIHISSMSVYEPFEAEVEFDEDSPAQPPQSDIYASGKNRIEELLRGNPSLSPRILMLRPTVVYGPFCRPWTDNLMAAFSSGDVLYRDMAGRIQPIYVEDVSNFVCACLDRFEPGVFNLAGPETLSWKEFFDFFSDIAPAGRLVRTTDSGPEALEAGGIRRFISNLMRLVLVCVQDPAFEEIAKPLARWLPDRLGGFLKRRLKDVIQSSKGATAQADTAPRPYCTSFFAEDRLVSSRRLKEHFGALPSTTLGESRGELERYFQYRFTDAVLS